MIRASIDIGSNSVLLLAAEIENETITNEVLNLSFITSLGKDLDKTKSFHPDSMKATYEALSSYKAELEKIKVKPENVIVTATEASRVASNAVDFYRQIKKDLGFSVTLISAEGEAYYTALGVVSSIQNSASELVVMDIGGASTELIKIHPRPFEIVKTISLPVGSVRATDWKKENQFTQKMSSILNKDFSEYHIENLMCVAGSMTSLASMFRGDREYDDKKIDGMLIDFTQFKKFTENLESTNVEQLLVSYPHLGKRAPMIAGGARVAVMTGEKLGVKKLTISTRGLRYGTLIKGVIDGQFTIGQIN